jgi:uncharacterized protein YegL
MKKGKSEVIIVLDRSGSMSSIKTDMEGGFKTFLEKQKKEPGECLVSLYQFDNIYEAVFEAKPIGQVDEIVLVPRGWTALRDAIGKTINSVGERLAKTPEDERPEVIILVVITDGMENASKEFSAAQIKEMVTHQTEKYDWKFIFLGANQDAVLTGSEYGTSKGLSITYAANCAGVAGTFSALTSGVSCLRACSSYSFSEQDRQASAGGTSVPSKPQT